MSKEKKGSMID